MKKAVKKVKKPDVIRLVAKTAGLTQSEISTAIKALIKVIQDTLVKGELISLSGLGSFRTKARKARIGRNPKTGDIVPVPPGKKVSFKPTTKLRKLIQ
ncbi:MAG: HU family DNA-binding protein [Elusimicrobiota bacterium]|jgi:nucleoid DNA-binding protein|nr:HU family DNA-binding protein [Elusimicrobiota bacterium]